MYIYNIVSSIIWAIAISLIIIMGIYFTYKLKFVQFRISKQLKSLKSCKDCSISSFQSLSMCLASRVGVGSISGVALAIYLGGSGVVFWMWISGLVASSITYVESVLGSIYKERKRESIYIGGPSYYIKKGLGNKNLALIYSIIIIFAYVFGFLPIQANTIVNAVGQVSNINYYVVILFVSISAFIIIYKDVKNIIKFSSIIVPLMGGIYLLLGIVIVINNFDVIPLIIKDIFTNAFSLKAGILGLFSTIILGVQRAIFASEAGIGTSAIASATSGENCYKLGLSQVLGIHFTIFIICNITAFIILTSNYSSLDIVNPNGIEVTINSFMQNFGNFGGIILCVVTILFAYSTIISGYYYGESNLEYIFPNIKNNSIKLFKIFTIIIIFLGGIISANIIWRIVDILLAFLTIINVYSIKKIFNK